MVHNWVKVTMQSVVGIVDPDTEEVYVFPGRDEPIRETAGCDSCGCPMTAEFMGLPCVEIDAPASAA